MKKDYSGLKRPVQIDPDEWWYLGNFIQRQIHPKLQKYIVRPNNDKSYLVYPCDTKKEAIAFCKLHPVNNPINQPTDFL